MQARPQRLTSRDATLRPYFASFVAEFDSNMNYFQAQEEPDTREYITGKAGELYRVGATNNTLANIQKVQARFLTALPGLIAMGEVFQASNVVSHLTFDPSNPPAGNRAATITPGNTLLVGENTAGNLLSEYLLGRNGNALSSAVNELIELPADSSLASAEHQHA